MIQKGDRVRYRSDPPHLLNDDQRRSLYGTVVDVLDEGYTLHIKYDDGITAYDSDVDVELVNPNPTHKGAVMATAKTPRTKMVSPPHTFDVVVEQVIGTVVMDGSGSMSPHESAMAMIAKHSSDPMESLSPQRLTYAFPGRGDNQRIEVIVQSEGWDIASPSFIQDGDF